MRNREVEPDVIAVGDEAFHHSAGAVEGERTLGPDSRALQDLEEPVLLAIGPGGARRDVTVSEAEPADKYLEAMRKKLEAFVRGDPGNLAGGASAGPLGDGFDVDLCHAFADPPMDDGAAESIEDGVEVVERSAEVEIRDDNTPVLMGGRLGEDVSLGRGNLGPTPADSADIGAILE